MDSLVCFDLDGVLVDACEWHRVALNKALIDFTGSSIPIEDHITIYNGLPTVKKLGMLGIKDQNLIQAISEKKQAYTMEMIMDLEKDSEKMNMLSYLVKKGYKLACVTNSIRMTASEMLIRSGLYDFFHLLVSNEDIRYPKPSPEGYITAMARLGCIPLNTWIFEDSENGIQAAINSTANVIKVWGPQEVTLDFVKGIL